LPKSVTICGVGSVDKSILEYLAECIAARYGLTCKISSGMESPEYAYNIIREQYNSKLILKHLLRQCPNDTLRFIGVTSVDLYVPILEFVFGLAQIEGQCSIVSLHRLYPKFYNRPPNPDLVLVRLLKTSLHELGHTFGITHCRDRRCVMYSSTRIEHTDFKHPDFCLTCSELFRWHIEKAMDQHPS
jgi:archaemetzincin